MSAKKRPKRMRKVAATEPVVKEKTFGSELVRRLKGFAEWLNSRSRKGA